jgi:hypothetical protein
MFQTPLGMMSSIRIAVVVGPSSLHCSTLCTFTTYAVCFYVPTNWNVNNKTKLFVSANNEELPVSKYDAGMNIKVTTFDHF